MNSQSHISLPQVPSYKELLKMKKNTSADRSKLSFSQTAKNIILPSNNSNIITSQYGGVNEANNIEYDFGSLYEFIDYDMGLKKAEDLFKIHQRNEKRNIKKDQYKKFATQFKHDTDNRDYKTILKVEEDPKKLQKAAKKLIKEMVDSIYGQDIDVLEDRVTRKAKNKYYELMQMIKDEEKIKKIMEKHIQKPLNEKIDLIEKLISKKKQMHGENKSVNDQLTESQQNQGGLNTQPSYHTGGSPALIRQSTNARRGLLMANSGSQSMSNLHIFDSAFAKGTSIRDSGKISEYQPITLDKSQNLKTKSYQSSVLQLIRQSSYLISIYKQYKSEDSQGYQKQVDELLKNWDLVYVDDYENIPYDKQLELLHTNYLILSSTQKSEKFLLHLGLTFQSFGSLWVLNLHGSGFNTALLHLMLEIVLKYCNLIQVIDVGGNQLDQQCCDVLSLILAERQLKKLKVAECDLNSRTFGELCLGMASNNSLVEIDASHNRIDDNGIKAFSIIMKSTFSISSLNLENNVITEQGKKDLYKALAFNKKIDVKSFSLFLD